jgi:predicted lipoprotein with Yx(FWY)xxD motif
MMRKRFIQILPTAAAIALVACFAGTTARGAASAASKAAVEQYESTPMPPGFQVLNNELEGPIYADAAGKTLYTWPFKALRAGESGDQIGKPTCGYKKTIESGGVLEPYPGGFTLPDLDKRLSCAQQYPPVFAADDAKAVGTWTIVMRPDGRKQWAYGGYPIYTSADDKRPGDVLGGSKRRGTGSGRTPIGPATILPPGFTIIQTVNGRMLATERGATVYISDRDRPGKSNCDERCAQTWIPVPAALFSESIGEWTIIERFSGVKQWAFRGLPLYTYVEDPGDVRGSLYGTDVPGWHNVFTQHVAPLPSDFTLSDTPHGQTVADHRGHTVYIYNCNEDVVDQFDCDTPDSPQQYRMAVCGRGDADKCLKTFPYVLASRNAENTSTLWTAILVNVRTGHLAAEGDKDAMRVWAYRSRPVFTFAGDKEPGDFNADGWGEGEGDRNGYRAFLVRDDFFRREQ